MRKLLARREFLGLAAAATGGVALAACTSAPPPPSATSLPAGTAVPTKAPAAAAQTTAPAAVAPSATSLPAGTKAPEPTKPAAAPTVAPTQPPAAATAAPAATKATDTRIGESLVGKLEGPEVIVDPAKFPKEFKEAPMLADLVKAGKLPAVKDRIGQDPLVIKPVHEIGKYGGIWRGGFTGVADYWLGVREGSGPDHLVYVDYTAQKLVPNIARAWEIGDGGRTISISLRRGMKWSDGQPFTADDFMFWFEDMYGNKDLVPAGTSTMAINGKPGTMEKVDATTVRWKFPDPYYMFLDLLAYGTVVASHALRGNIGMGSVAPAHYLKQFHPKYVSAADLDKKVKDAKMDGWVSLFKFKNCWWLNPELPTIAPYVTKSPANTPAWTLERNPYSIWVDTEGNQLPYIDKMSLTLAENLEVLNLRAIAGEYDMQARNIGVSRLPVLIENQQKGNYKVSINRMGNGSDCGLYFNLDYPADAEINKWFNNVDFRRALSLGIEREQFNETFLVGTGIPGSAAPTETNRFSPGPEYRTLWHKYDVKTANEMLDKMGLDKKDGEGYRLRTDGKGRLRIEIANMAGAFLPYAEMSEMLKVQWKKIGIDIDVKELERSLVIKRGLSNETMVVATWNSDSETLYVTPQSVLPYDPNNDLAMVEYGRWVATLGKAGKEPPARMRQVIEMWMKGFGVPEEEANKLGKEIWKIAVEDVWFIGIVGQSPAIMGVQVTKNNFGNVPGRIVNLNLSWPPGPTRPMTYFFKS